MGNPYLLARKMRLLTVCLCSMLLVLSQAAPLRRMGKGVILAKGDKTLAIDVYAGKTRTVGTKLHLWKVHKGRAQQLQSTRMVLSLPHTVDYLWLLKAEKLKEACKSSWQ